MDDKQPDSRRRTLPKRKDCSFSSCTTITEARSRCFLRLRLGASSKLAFVFVLHERLVFNPLRKLGYTTPWCLIQVETQTCRAVVRRNMSGGTCLRLPPGACTLPRKTAAIVSTRWIQSCVTWSFRQISTGAGFQKVSQGFTEKHWYFVCF